MRLNGQERRALRDALVSAFPTASALTELVDVALDEQLNHIADEANHKATTFELIKWAEARGRVEALVRAAYGENPGNPEMAAFARHHLLQTPATPATPATPSGLNQEELAFLVDTALHRRVDRDLLLAWLPRDVVHTLPIKAIPLQQYQSDVTLLSQHRLAGTQKPPLVVWVRNLARLIAPFAEAERVKQIGDGLEGP